MAHFTRTQIDVRTKALQTLARGSDVSPKTLKTLENENAGASADEVSFARADCPAAFSNRRTAINGASSSRRPHPKAEFGSVPLHHIPRTAKCRRRSSGKDCRSVNNLRLEAVPVLVRPVSV
jgi:hypothetical protein